MSTSPPQSGSNSQILHLPAPSTNRVDSCDHWTLEDAPVCAICRGDLSSKLIRLACSHAFHERCFTSYEDHLQDHQDLRCPICRRQIPKRNEEGEPQSTPPRPPSYPAFPIPFLGNRYTPGIVSLEPREIGQIYAPPRPSRPKGQESTFSRIFGKPEASALFPWMPRYTLSNPDPPRPGKRQFPGHLNRQTLLVIGGRPR